jgi:serine/threonine protein kinase
MLSTGMLVQNRYRIVEKLGSGGFGEVFAVRDEKSCHKVQVIKVLKVLNLENFPASEKDKAIALFQREAQVLSKLNHPGIPKVEPQGYFTIENDRKTIHCLVMEKIIGENLLTWLKQRDNQPIASSLAIDWLKQMLEILQELHQNHYFHRDIKPENIMVQPNGKLVLIDFGGVRQINNTYLVKLGEDAEHTRLMSPEGYTPIEQMNGKAVPQSDFFALGRTMVHLLTGIVPVNLPENETTGDLIWRDRASEIPDKLADLLDEMMALFPRERPSSTEVILSRLNDLESLESLESGDSAGKFIPSKNIITENFIKKKGAIASIILFLTVLAISWPLASNNLAVAMNKRGISYHKIEEFKSAKIYYKIAILLKSDYGQAYYNLGSLYEDENDDENDNASAIREYEQAIKYNNPAAYNNLGRIYLLKQRERDCYRAAFLLLEGLEIATKDLVKYGLLTNLGRAQLCLEEHEKAQEYLETAIAIKGDRPEAYCILARVMYDLKDEYGTKDALAKCPIDSVNLPELDNWLIAKGGQKMLEQ